MKKKLGDLTFLVKTETLQSRHRTNQRSELDVPSVDKYGSVTFVSFAKSLFP